jgi:protein-tyrosine phosphatase
MKYIDENNIDKIDDKLWIANYNGANIIDELKKNKIDIIINLYEKKLNNYDNIKYYHIPYKFHEISYNDSWNKIEILLNIFNKHNNKNILVNCKSGHHRSANAIILYLINKYHINYQQAKKYIKKIRKHALDRNSNMTIAMETYGNMIYYLYN